MLLKSDPILRKRTDIHINAAADEMVIHTQRDATELVAENKAHLNLFRGARDRWGDGDLVGRIDPLVWVELEKAGVAYDDDALLAWLDERDNGVWKVRPGKLV